VHIDKETLHPQSSYGLLTLTQPGSNVKCDLITYWLFKFPLNVPSFVDIN